MRPSAIQTLSVAAGLSAAFIATESFAHHSFAMFDLTKQVELKGVVKEFHWSNPHTAILVTVNENGKPVVYDLEGQQVRVMANSGFRRDSLKPGDRVTVTMRPLRDGRKGGLFQRVVKADGTVLGGGAAAGPAK